MRHVHVNIVTVGRELLEGRVDTNAAWLAAQLTARGFTVERILSVGDDPRAIAEAARAAAAGASAVVMTGGLGVTPDDLTRRAVADLAGVPLVEDAATTDRLRARYAREGRELRSLAAEQALVPRGVTLIRNPTGHAPGLRARVGRAMLYAMPGVPVEMTAMAEEEVFPDLETRGHLPARAVRVLSLWGMAEADVAERIAPLVAEAPGVNVSYLPTVGRLELVLSMRSRDRRAATRTVTRLAAAIRRRLGEVVFASGAAGRSLEEVIGEELLRREMRIAVAESLTGGRIGALLTRVPGASRYVDRVVVTYSNIAKERELGVPRAMLLRHGAVSPEVAEAMARGVRRAARVEIGLATTGIAGPTGATPTKPVGLVYVAIASGRRAAVRCLLLSGTRDRIQLRSTNAALDALRLWLQIMEPAGRSRR